MGVGQRYYATGGVGGWKVNGGKGGEKGGRKARRNREKPREKDVGKQVQKERLPHTEGCWGDVGQKGRMSLGLESSPKLASSSSQTQGPKRSLSLPLLS